MKVVVDATVLIALGAAGQIGLLHSLWEAIFVPPAVLAEVEKGKPGYDEVQWARTEGWLVERLPKLLQVKESPPLKAGSGEAECLRLAREVNADLILTDDMRARKAAENAGFVVLGSVGVILKSFRISLLTRQQVLQTLEAWQTINFRLNEDIVEQITREVC